MILYICLQESAARYDGRRDERIEKVVGEIELLRFVQQGTTNLAHCSKLLIDMDALQDGEDEILLALRNLCAMYAQAQIGIIAQDMANDDPMQIDLRELGVTLFVGQEAEIIHHSSRWLFGEAQKQEQNTRATAGIVSPQFEQPYQQQPIWQLQPQSQPHPQSQPIQQSQPQTIQPRRHFTQNYVCEAPRVNVSPESPNGDATSALAQTSSLNPNQPTSNAANWISKLWEHIRFPALCAYMAVITLLGCIGFLTIFIKPVRQALMQFYFGG